MMMLLQRSFHPIALYLYLYLYRGEGIIDGMSQVYSYLKIQITLNKTQNHSNSVSNRILASVTCP